MTNPERGPDSRLTPVLLVIVASLAIGGLLWWTQVDHRPRAEKGRFIKASEVPAGTWTKVPTPWEPVDVMLSEPEAELHSYFTEVDSSELRAPKGGSFVGIMVKFKPGEFVPVVRTAGTSEDQVKRPTFSLVADGHRYPLGEQLGYRGADGTKLLHTSVAGYFAVPGRPKQVQVEVEYDGERGLYGVRGAPNAAGRFGELAAPLTRGDQTAALKPCGTPVLPTRIVPAAFDKVCQLGLIRRDPYVAGLGWAPPGKNWVTAQVVVRNPEQVTWTSANGTAVKYLTRGISAGPTYRFDGTREPVDSGSAEIPGGRTPIWSAPRGAAVSLTIAVGWKLSLDIYEHRKIPWPDDAPREQTVSASWRITVP